MAMNSIYVETEEEIPEIVERLRRSSGRTRCWCSRSVRTIGQSRFNFQLLRNYASRMGKRVTVVCDDPAVQKMASESGFTVFGAVGVRVRASLRSPRPRPPPKQWWKRGRASPTTHVGIAAPTQAHHQERDRDEARAFPPLCGRGGAPSGRRVRDRRLRAFGLDHAAGSRRSPFHRRRWRSQAQPGKPPIRVRVVGVTRSDSQGFKTTGSIRVVLAPATGSVVYTNNCRKGFNDGQAFSFRGASGY